VRKRAAKEAKAKARRGQNYKNATQEVIETTTSASTIKRGRKHKSAALEVEANSADGDANQSVPKRKVARANNVQVAEATEVSWVAPLAKMYYSSWRNRPHPYELVRFVKPLS
jgi:hypothetical protein